MCFNSPKIYTAYSNYNSFLKYIDGKFQLSVSGNVFFSKTNIGFFLTQTENIHQSSTSLQNEKNPDPK